MASNPLLLTIVLLLPAAFVLNLPFGYLRIKTRKFSVMWFLCIHLPIPFLFVLRTLAGVSIGYVPIIAIGAIAGQFLGGRLKNLNPSSTQS